MHRSEICLSWVSASSASNTFNTRCFKVELIQLILGFKFVFVCLFFCVFDFFISDFIIYAPDCCGFYWISSFCTLPMQQLTKGVTESRPALFTYCCWFLAEIHNPAERKRLVSLIFTFCSVSFLFTVVEFLWWCLRRYTVPDLFTRCKASKWVKPGLFMVLIKRKKKMDETLKARACQSACLHSHLSQCSLCSLYALTLTHDLILSCLYKSCS